MWWRKKQLDSEKVVPTDTEETSKNEKLLILFNRPNFTARHVDYSGSSVLLGKPETYSWDSKTLASSLAQLKINYPNVNEVEIILGHDLAIVTTLLVPESKDIEKAAIHKAQETFGSAFNDLALDYTVSESQGKNTSIQVFAVRQAFLELLSQALDKSHLEVTAIQSLSVSLSQQVDTTNKNTLILWGEDYLYGVVAANNQVVVAENLVGEDIYNLIESLISSVEARYNINIQSVLMSSSKLDPKKVKKIAPTEEAELNPFAGAAGTNQEFGMDMIFTETEEENSDTETDTVDETTSDSVETKVGRESSEKSGIITSETAPVAPKPPLTLVNKDEEEMESVTQPPSRSNAKLIAIIVTVVVVLLGMVIGGFFVYQNAMSEANQPPEIIVTETPVPQPTTEPEPGDASESGEPSDDTSVTENELDVSSLDVEVLNGSGIPGAAGDLAADLEAAGFESIDTGNASAYDYEETVVSVKAGQTELFELVEQALDDYTVIQGDDLDEDADYDVSVIVGQS